MAIAGEIYSVAQCEYNSTLIETYFTKSFPQVYSTTGYTGGAIEFFLELINFYCVFLWSFMDLLIVTISICLSTRLNQFNENLRQYRGMVGNAARVLCDV